MVSASVCSKQLDFGKKKTNAHPFEQFCLSPLSLSIRLSIRSYVCKKRLFSIPELRINFQGIFSISPLVTIHVKVSWESLWPKYWAIMHIHWRSWTLVDFFFCRATILNIFYRRYLSNHPFLYPHMYSIQLSAQFTRSKREMRDRWPSCYCTCTYLYVTRYHIRPHDLSVEESANHTAPKTRISCLWLL